MISWLLAGDKDPEILTSVLPAADKSTLFLYSHLCAGTSWEDGLVPQIKTGLHAVLEFSPESSESHCGFGDLSLTCLG